jgi:hypothetical protein
MRALGGCHKEYSTGPGHVRHYGSIYCSRVRKNNINLNEYIQCYDRYIYRSKQALPSSRETDELATDDKTTRAAARGMQSAVRSSPPVHQALRLQLSSCGGRRGGRACPELCGKYLSIIFLSCVAATPHRIVEIIENVLSIYNYNYLWNRRHVCKTSA